MSYIEELRALVGTRPLILVGAVAIVRNEAGAILLEKRRHPYGKWGLPGGLLEIGETTEEAARREVLEETGLTIGALKLEGVFSGPKHYLRAANGDEIHSVTISYSTSQYSGVLQIDPRESLAFEFVDPRDYLAKMMPNCREMIESYLGS